MTIDMNINRLPIKNLARRTGRTTALLILVILLAVSMMGGSLIVSSLQSGLDNLQTRLGADVIVVPDEAKSKKDLESILLDGVPGYFYMDKAYLEKVAAREGVAKASPQYYLASAKAGCCSMPVQVIGFDPETDFTVSPWISQRYKGELEKGEIVAGYGINKGVGDTLAFFGVDCTIVAKLDRTGTALDNAVYGTFDTIREMIEGSKKNSFKYFSQQNPDDIISSILIDVEEDYDIDQVVGDINVHVRGVEATATKSMLSGVSDSLAGISRIIRLLIAVVWILMLIILFVVFSAMIGERKKEFAILRVAGMSRKMLAKVILTESGILSLAGGLIGCVFAAVMMIPVNTIMKEELALPFLMPGAGKILIFALITLVLTVLVGAVASSYAAVKLSKVDTGLILKEGN